MRNLENRNDLRNFQSFGFRQVEEEYGEQDSQNDGEGHERQLLQLRL
jgi:hypothetical protein